MARLFGFNGNPLGIFTSVHVEIVPGAFETRLETFAEPAGDGAGGTVGRTDGRLYVRRRVVRHGRHNIIIVHDGRFARDDTSAGVYSVRRSSADIFVNDLFFIAQCFRPSAAAR